MAHADAFNSSFIVHPSSFNFKVHPIMEDEEQNMEEIVTAIKQALSNLKFGSIEITVHDAKVVQIERKEKVRLNSGVNQKGARNV